MVERLHSLRVRPGRLHACPFGERDPGQQQG